MGADHSGMCRKPSLDRALISVLLPEAGPPVITKNLLFSCNLLSSEYPNRRKANFRAVIT
jgi:hypothetical protein